MPRFSYSAYTNAGVLESGELQAETDVAALDQISAKGLTPVSLQAGGTALSWWQRDITFGGKQTAKPAALEHFFKTMGGLLLVNLSLPRALQFCEGNTTDPAMRKTLSRIQMDVSGGSTFGEALGGSDGFFPDRLITLVEIGEAADRLPEITTRIAESLTLQSEQSRQLRSAMIYPLILVAMSFLVLARLVFFLTPTLTPVFASANAELPTILNIMAAVREAILTKWPLLLASGGLAILLFTFLRASIAKSVSRLLIHLPLFGSYLKQSETLKIFQTLALMLASGATLPRAIVTTQTSIRHPSYVNLMVQAEQSIIGGGKLSDVLSKNALIDPMSAAMLEAGEETDRMVPVLEQLVRDLQTRTSRTLAEAIRLITPLMTLVIGLSVGGIILSTITAIMALNDVAF